MLHPPAPLRCRFLLYIKLSTDLISPLLSLVLCRQPQLSGKHRSCLTFGTQPCYKADGARPIWMEGSQSRHLKWTTRTRESSIQHNLSGCLKNKTSQLRFHCNILFGNLHIHRREETAEVWLLAHADEFKQLCSTEDEERNLTHPLFMPRLKCLKLAGKGYRGYTRTKKIWKKYKLGCHSHFKSVRKLAAGSQPLIS